MRGHSLLCTNLTKTKTIKFVSSLEFTRFRRKTASSIGNRLEVMATLFARMVLRDLGANENEFEEK